MDVNSQDNNMIAVEISKTGIIRLFNPAELFFLFIQGMVDLKAEPALNCLSLVIIEKLVVSCLLELLLS